MAKRGRNLDAPSVLFDHVRELQKRLLFCAVILIAAGTGAYFVYNQILAFLVAPLHQPLYYSTPTGSFSFIMRICLMAGLLFAVPTITYNLVMFLKPAFPKLLRTRVVVFTTITSVLLAVAGVAFGYFLILPGALKFFTGFQINNVHPLISADSYLNFVIGVLITFLLIFQLPLLMSLIDRIKPIKPRTLFKMEKWVILLGLLVALVVPFAMDLTTCLLIAGPIVALYNFSILLVLTQHAIKNHAKRPARKKKIAPNPVIEAIASDQPPLRPTAPKVPFVDIRPATIAEAQERAIQAIAAAGATQLPRTAHLQTTSPRVYARRVDMVIPRRNASTALAPTQRRAEPANVLPQPKDGQSQDVTSRLISDFRVQNN